METLLDNGQLDTLYEKEASLIELVSYNLGETKTISCESEYIYTSYSDSQEEVLVLFYFECSFTT